jgi:hypothetical protein
MLWMGWIMIVLGLYGPPLVVLWPPGLILVIAAYRQRKPTCGACKGRKLIPTSTPQGQELTNGASKSARILLAVEEELDSGLPIHMVIQKLITRGVEEEAASQIAIAAAGDNIQECDKCQLFYCETVKRCLSCGGVLRPYHRRETAV